jgi:hypothetical protein
MQFYAKAKNPPTLPERQLLIAFDSPLITGLSKLVDMSQCRLCSDSKNGYIFLIT